MGHGTDKLAETILINACKEFKNQIGYYARPWARGINEGFLALITQRYIVLKERELKHLQNEQEEYFENAETEDIVEKYLESLPEVPKETMAKHQQRIVDKQSKRKISVPKRLQPKVEL